MTNCEILKEIDKNYIFTKTAVLFIIFITNNFTHFSRKQIFKFPSMYVNFTNYVKILNQIHFETLFNELSINESNLVEGTLSVNSYLKIERRERL